jgi:hypothetical protein
MLTSTFLGMTTFVASDYNPIYGAVIAFDLFVGDARRNGWHEELSSFAATEASLIRVSM